MLMPEDEMEDFPWTYDQLQRYSVLREFLDVFHAGKDVRVLDVGGVSPDREGLGRWLPLKHLCRESEWKSYALDVKFCGECRDGDFVQGSGTHLPFKNAAFDVVSALDVIEHVEPGGREDFLKELCRVARGSVVVSAPFKDEKIETAETLLFEQIRRLHGAEHGQLREHRKHGLPERASVSLFLGQYMKYGVSFGFGSLSNWIFLQTIKNLFLFRKNAGRIHCLLDRWMTEKGKVWEFEPPFSRLFWIYSKDIGQVDLEEGVAAIKKNLREKERAEVGFPELARLHGEIVEYLTGDRVSALVVASGKGAHLEECLNHLLTQRVDFDLEVAVWDIEGNPEKERLVKERFPQLKYFSEDGGRRRRRRRAAGALLKVLSRLIGNYILLVSEDVLLPLDSVKNFYEQLKAASGSGVLTPRIVWKRYFTPVWGGGRFSLKRPAAGRLIRPAGRLTGKSIGKKTRWRWLYSECLFFRREALFEREFDGRRLSRRRVFLWKNWGENWGLSPIFIEHTVHKR